MTPLKKILLAIALAIVVGYYTGPTNQIFGVTYFHIFEFIGDLFLNALKLLVIPLIMSAIISSLGKMNGEKSFKQLGMKTFGFYFLTIGCAVLIGVILSNLISPGTSFVSSSSSELPQVNLILDNLDKRASISQILMNFVPANIFLAISQGNMLGILSFSLLFGFALMKLEGKIHDTLITFWTGMFAIFMKMTQFVMKLMPIGVFCLIAKTVASQGLQCVTGLTSYFITVVLALFLFTFIVLPLVIKLAGLSPMKHFKAISPAIFTAFTTSSSAASLPVTMECLEKRVGVSQRVCNFVVPLGTSMNMAGSALYECVAVFFIAQIYGLQMGIFEQILVASLSLLTSMGVAGIPSASLVAIMIILKSMGLPEEALAFIIPLDRILDMFRTTTNICSDATCAVLVAKSEGETLFKEELQVQEKEL